VDGWVEQKLQRHKGAEIHDLHRGLYGADPRHLEGDQIRQRLLQPDVHRAGVCMCGSDGTFDSMGEGTFVNFDGTPLVEGSHRADEIITCELRPDLVA